MLRREATLENEYLRVQCGVVRSKAPGRIRFTEEERRRLGDAPLAIGRKAVRSVVSIVKPETILAWQRRLEQEKWDYSERRQQGPGRPRTPGEVEALVCRLARENTWGDKRIGGELKELGIKLSKSCISDILRRNSLPPSPERQGLTWRDFLARRADVLLCADLFSKGIPTFRGLRRALVLVVMHLKSRTILLADGTFSPQSGWMAQQVRHVLWECDDLGIRPRFLLHDRDKWFGGDFATVLQDAGVGSLATPCHAPDADAHCERWIRSAPEECLNHLILFGLKSLRRAVQIYRVFHNDHRPHQGIANRVARAVRTGEPVPEVVSGPIGNVQCEENLGGLLKSQRRDAA